MIKLTAYDTIGVSGVLTRKIQDSLEKANISSSLNKIEHKSTNVELDFTYSLVEGGNTYSDNIPFFVHPILFNTHSKDIHGQPIKELALDVRNFGKFSTSTDSYIVRNKPEYDWALGRLILNNIWLKGRYNILRDISPVPLAVYSTLISECLTRRFALNHLDQYTIAVLAGYFYYSLFTNEEQFEEMDYSRIISSINRATKIPVDLITNTLESLDRKVIKDITELCDKITVITNNEALKLLNAGILISLVSNLWFGYNAKEIMAVGLEHPPTWVMIVYASLFENTYTRSLLSKTSERLSKGGLGDNFEKSIKVILNPHQ